MSEYGSLLNLVWQRHNAQLKTCANTSLTQHDMIFNALYSVWKFNSTKLSLLCHDCKPGITTWVELSPSRSTESPEKSGLWVTMGQLQPTNTINSWRFVMRQLHLVRIENNTSRVEPSVRETWNMLRCITQVVRGYLNKCWCQSNLFCFLKDW